MEKDKCGYWIKDYYGIAEIYIKSTGNGRLDESDADVVGEQVGGIVQKVLEGSSEKGLNTRHFLINPKNRKKFYVSISKINNEIRISLPSRVFNKKGMYQKPIKTDKPEKILDFKDFYKVD